MAEFTHNDVVEECKLRMIAGIEREICRLVTPVLEKRMAEYKQSFGRFSRTDASLPSDDPVNTFNMEGFGGSAHVPHEETTTCVITKHDRIRLGNVNKRRSLTDNFTTVINLYERALMTPAQIDAANTAEVFEAEYVIELALEVLHDTIPEE